jgi:hypothetical protein
MVRVMRPEHIDEYVQLMAEYPKAVALRDKSYTAVEVHESYENRRAFEAANRAVEKIVARLTEIHPE